MIMDIPKQKRLAGTEKRHACGAVVSTSVRLRRRLLGSSPSARRALFVLRVNGGWAGRALTTGNPASSKVGGKCGGAGA